MPPSLLSDALAGTGDALLDQSGVRIRRAHEFKLRKRAGQVAGLLERGGDPKAGLGGKRRIAGLLLRLAESFTA